MPPNSYHTYTSYNPQNLYPSKKKSRRFIKALITLFFLFLVLFTLFKLVRFEFQKVDIPKFSSHFSFNFAREESELDKIINENLLGAKGKFAVYIEPLALDRRDKADIKGYSLRSSEVFPAASLYKIFLVAAVLKEVEQGNLNLDDIVSASKAHLEEVLGGEEFGYEGSPDTITYTVEEALDRVGRISDNFAAILLAEKISWDKVQSFAEEIGAKDTKIKTPKDILIQTTASDVAEFFRLLYEDKIVSPSVSDKIKNYLTLKLSKVDSSKSYGQITSSPFVSRIPFGIPSNVKIVHKTGELSRIRHDAGIVYLEGYPYVIVLMSKELEDENEGIEVLANISKEVYEYFLTKKL